MPASRDYPAPGCKTRTLNRPSLAPDRRLREPLRHSLSCVWQGVVAGGKQRGDLCCMTEAPGSTHPLYAPAQSPRPGWITALALFVAWTVFGLLSSAHFFFGYEGASGYPSFIELADNVIVFYWGWALLTPVVILIAKRIANGLPRWSDLPLLAAAGIGVMIIHGVLHITLTRLFGLDKHHINGYTLVDYVTRHGGGDLATFGVLVGAYFLIEANRRARARELAAVELSARLARADLELLRWHLHPHFLFNALNTVSTLVLKGDNEDASRAITLISRYLRSGIAQRADSMVPVGDDIAMVQRYVDIEILRFGDSLKLEIDANDEALRAMIPESLLQPLVENAIAHGNVRGSGADPITIRAATAGGRLHLTVVNPGSITSADHANVARVTHGDADSESPDSARFGLRYVRERLRHFYGDDASFKLATVGDETVASLDIPLRLASSNSA